MIKIELLKDHLHTIPELAQIWYEVLGKIWLPEVPVTLVEQRFLEHANTDKMPLTFVALYENKPVGMCSLRENDGIRPDLMPWLGSLTVKPEFQGQGIGKQLIEVTRQCAITMGFDKLYLFAFDLTVPDYYQSVGWKTIDRDTFKGHPVTVMENSLV